MGNKVVFEEDPPPSHFGAGDQTGLRALPQLLRVHMEEGGGGGEVEAAQGGEGRG
ncbi:MAG: hypothetical protein U1F10_07630 [Burkholderiales bacterium]